MGNIDARRDWGHAKDYVEAMWLMLQQEKPEDFVIATGVTTSVRDFIRAAFMEAGIEIEFKGSHENEKAFVVKCNHPDYKVETGQCVMQVDKKYYRPTEVELLIGDSTKAQTKLGWKPKHDLNSIVKEMVESDLKLFSKDKYLKEGGHEILNYRES